MNYYKKILELTDSIKLGLELSDSGHELLSYYNHHERALCIRIDKKYSINHRKYIYGLHKAHVTSIFSILYNYEENVVYIRSTIRNKFNNIPFSYQVICVRKMYDEKNATPKYIGICFDNLFVIEHNFKMSKNNFQRLKNIMHIFLSQI